MFEYLNQIDSRIYERYLTLERNIKAASNSFYDSYLDLQEQTVRTVIADAGMSADVRETCGVLLKRDDITAYFIEKLGLDKHSYDKMGDYALKINAHKHKNEKKIQADTVVNYMKVFNAVIRAFAAYKEIAAEEFDVDYYVGLFGSYDKENTVLLKQTSTLKEELSALVEQRKLKDSDIEAYKGLLSQAEISKLGIEEQNAELQRQISRLKDIKLSSMEDKLNKSLDLLLELQESVVENRAISYAVGDTICGSGMFKSYVERAREELKHE